MNLIAFDTAWDTFSIGLAVKKQCYYLELNNGQKHSELIMEGMELVLGMAGIEKTDLQRIACMEGPGSFTGLRIGFATAKGLAFALDLPLIPVPTLDCMAYSYSFWPGIVIPVIDAKKNAYFCALYLQGKRICDYLDSSIEELISLIKDKNIRHPLLITGPAASLVFPALNGHFPGTVVTTDNKRGYAAELLILSEKTCILTAEENCGPMYLRKSDAELLNEHQLSGKQR